MARASDVDSSSAYSSLSSSSSEDEGDRCKNKKASKNLSGLSCFAGDGFCGLACSSGSKKSHQSDSDSNSVSHPILQGKLNASHMCGSIYTHMIDKRV
jgi:hypothetical protein